MEGFEKPSSDLVESEGTPIDLPEIEQVAFVVEDIDTAVRTYHDVLGIGPWRIYRHGPSDFTEATYYDEPIELDIDLAIAEVGETMYELIAPNNGTNCYQAHLDVHGEGLHHVAYFSWDEDETYDVVEKLTDAGVQVMQRGVVHDTEFWYFDLRSELNGLVFETAVRRNVDDREFETYP